MSTTVPSCVETVEHLTSLCSQWYVLYSLFKRDLSSQRSKMKKEKRVITTSKTRNWSSNRQHSVRHWEWKEPQSFFGISAISLKSDRGKIHLSSVTTEKKGAPPWAVPLTSGCCLHPHWQQLECFFFDVDRLFELLLIPVTDNPAGF